MKRHTSKDYPPIENYGIVGNQHTVALVGIHGSIDFMCFPRFDSPSIFASLLDKEKGGSFQISPQLNEVDYKQMYLPDTNVLLSRFLAYEGMVEITDFMPVREIEKECVLIRKVTVVRGEVNFKMRCCPRFDYARAEHEVSMENDNQASFSSKGDDGTIIKLMSDVALQEEGQDVNAEFTLKEKESANFLLVAVSDKSYEPDFEGHLKNYIEGSFHETLNYWKKWMNLSSYRGRWRDMVHRSALTLKLLTSYQFGSPVAAATFGLPEKIGGERNWDYRYTWVRDAAFTMYAFIRLGFTREAGEFMKWIRMQFDKNIDENHELQLMYSISGESELNEGVLDHLEGYQKSSPVRIGNDAYAQKQLDIYGELMDSIYLYDKYGEPVTYDFWEKMVYLVDYVCEHWQDPDHGIWEVRSGRKEFLYSRVMCWVAVDRAIRLAEKRSFPYDWDYWRNTRSKIFEDVYYNFWDDELESFVQYKGSKTLDASALLMPLVRFISPYDPRWQKTLAAIEKELVTDTLVYRYNNETANDGIEGDEGTFSMCSFWYVECLCRGGQVEKARLYFEKMLGYASHLGLYAEEIGLRGEQLGNFPQAFTHLGLISAAFSLNRELEKAHKA
uniref:Glycoside hydrolase family 15 protein n=1 Tax=Roseihalotalea indica TaxID=2867963 RepID=A0AA49JGZ0_9BACT|nr:glycoside hydrolase family 15 protein [Tunicatimonas sp. TK19036]